MIRPFQHLMHQQCILAWPGIAGGNRVFQQHKKTKLLASPRSIRRHCVLQDLATANGNGS